ncbi:MAG: hypothetical protein KJZ53_08935 [Anaerolineales bacterium]|nr:hypothetical protein [Anaerolineales bacterium]
MSQQTQENRPWGVTVLLGLVLMFTALQATRVWAALSSWAVLNSLPLQAPPAYLLASGLVWAAAGAGLLYGLGWRKAWAPRAARIGAGVYALFFWADRLLVQARGPHNSSWIFEAVLGSLLLGSLFAILASPDAKAYYEAKRHQE